MPRPPIPVRAATHADSPLVQRVLARAFADDPVMRHLFPDDATRPERLRRFFALVARAESDPADTLIAEPDETAATGDGAAVTVWRKPGAWRTPVAAMLRLALPMLATFGTGLPRALRVQDLLEKHHPREPHWYLEFAGCDPARQGRGLGGAAIRARLAETDAAGIATALETANPVNLPIYTALGFRETGTFDVPGGPTFWTMWRDPI